MLGPAADATLAVPPPLESMVARSALRGRSDCAERYRHRNVYWRGLWPRPRDGLMTGLHASHLAGHCAVSGRRSSFPYSLIGWLLGVNLASEPSSTRASIGPLDPAVPAVVQPARQPQRGQPSLGK